MRAFATGPAAVRAAFRRVVRGGFAVLLLGAMLAAQPLAGQDVPSAVSNDTVQTAAAAPAALPAPGTQRAYWHVFLAFGIAWALLLGYVVLLNRRLAEAERDLARLGGSER